ncbi:hypothetical protein H257_15891 [Aphanomyces astaci]|uniref:Uncharacterized protein n=1 Tax=Aphanomyces astaci TaxID=112090 RepID=W4FMN3_APHAT|nr:hypothetical protein H257_15891 [Aphanomyces astaci]ETV68161.1 hypothetical protein H257_15891 [Aphanomyces astaci]|eukprot:XP_009842460.1 hypothetical protein H257_15891 [Aphanomyces astaci]
MTYGAKIESDVNAMDASTAARIKQFVKLRRRAKKTVQGVLAEFNTLGDLSVAEPPSNTTNHRTTVLKTRAVRDLVRTFIRDRSVTRTRTVGKDVLALLQEHNVVSVDVSCKKSYGSCLRAVQSYLAKQGYARGKRVGATEYRNEQGA